MKFLASFPRRRALAAVALGLACLHAPHPGRAQTLPAPEASGIQHIIVVTMENRSFDHLIGWTANTQNANGIQAGLSYLDTANNAVPTFSIVADPAFLPPQKFTGFGSDDPNHDYDGLRVHYNNGRGDGVLKTARVGDRFPVSYYRQEDLAFFSAVIPAFTVMDNYFCPVLGPTFPNRFYFFAASTDRISNTFTTSTLPTIFDRLARKGISARYYFNDTPFIGLFGNRFTPITKRLDQFLLDCQNNTLPAYSQLDPMFQVESAGTSIDDHPFADLRAGQTYLNRIYNAVTQSPAWPSTVLIFVYDDGGGFYDHVVPSVGAIGQTEITAGYTDGLRGFRVPCFIVSPLARRGVASSKIAGLPADAVYDHASILKMVEWRYKLAPLAARDAAARNLAEVLDFSGASAAVPPPVVNVPPVPLPTTLPSAVNAQPAALNEFSILGLRGVDEAPAPR